MDSRQTFYVCCGKFLSYGMECGCEYPEGTFGAAAAIAALAQATIYNNTTIINDVEAYDPPSKKVCREDPS
jgi:hypothetical protein